MQEKVTSVQISAESSQKLGIASVLTRNSKKEILEELIEDHLNVRIEEILEPIRREREG